MFQRAGHQHAADRGILGRHASHLVEDGEGAVDLGARRPIAFDGAGEVLAEAAVQKVVVIADVKSGFGKEVREVLLEILVNAVKTGPRFAVRGRFAFLHFGLVTPPWSAGRYTRRERCPGCGARTLRHNDLRCNRKLRVCGLRHIDALAFATVSGALASDGSGGSNSPSIGSSSSASRCSSSSRSGSALLSNG